MTLWRSRTKALTFRTYHSYFYTFPFNGGY